MPPEPFSSTVIDCPKPTKEPERLFNRANERRRSPRYTADDLAMIFFNGQSLSCRVHDLSLEGAQLEFSTSQIPERFILMNFVTKQKVAAQVQWRKHLRVGVRFISTPKRFSEGFETISS